MKTTFNRALACALPLLLAACGGAQDPISPTTVTLSSAKRSNADTTLTAYYDVVQRVYVGYYGRPADTAGLEYWAGQYKAFGMPLTMAEISSAYATNPTVKLFVDAFGTSAEASALYSGDNDAFVSAIYRNLFNTPGDSAGRAFWVNALNRGDMTRGIAALYIMSGAQSTDITSINKKIEIAKSFTSALNTEARRSAYAGDSSLALVRSMLQTVDANTDTATFTGVNSTIGTLENGSGGGIAGQYLSFIYDQTDDGKARIGLVPATGGQGFASLPNVLSTMVGGFTSATVQNGLASNFAAHSLVFWKGERLYRQNLISSSGLPTADIRSTLTLSQVCAEDAPLVDAFDMVDPSLSYQVFRQGGPDTFCNTADDTFAAVRMNMAATSAPLTVNEPLFAIHAANGALSGFLVKNGKSVQRVDTNFANPVTLFTMAKDITSSGNQIDQLGNLFVFTTGDALGREMHLWDASSSAPGTPAVIATATDFALIGEAASIDNQDIFIPITNLGSTAVVRYNVAAKTRSTVGSLVHTPGASISMHLSPTKVILYNAAVGALAAMPRAGGAPQALVTGAGGLYGAASLQVAGERVWVNSLFGKVVTVNTDGSGAITMPTAQFAGCVYKAVIQFAANANTCSAILLVDGGVFKDYDAASAVLKTSYGTLPSTTGQNFYGMSSFAVNGQGAILTRITANSNDSYSISNFHFKAGSAGVTEVKVQ